VLVCSFGADVAAEARARAKREDRAVSHVIEEALREAFGLPPSAAIAT
jgi:hypothetical protein